MATDDGDFVDLDWSEPAPTSPRDQTINPLLLILHGLEGDVRSHYVGGMLREAAAREWRAVVLHFRSCSGELNRLPRFYHSGDTGDLELVVRRLLEREPDVRLVAAGFSIGGNVLLKWLGEKAKVRDKARVYPDFVDVQAVLRARTFAEYDRALTAPLHGFADERDYWARASSKPYLAHVRRPTLLINALDDPFVPAGSLPDPKTLPPEIEVEFVADGGHVGFLDGPPWALRSWAERRAVAWLADVLEREEHR